MAAVCGAGGAWIARSAALGLEALLPGRAATLAGLAAGGAAYLGAMALTGQWKKIAPVRKRPA